MPDKKLIEGMYRYKVDFDNAARGAGGKITFASQHSMLWGGIEKGAFTSMFKNGVCAGLSIEWLKRRADGDNFLDEFHQIRNIVFTGEDPEGGLKRFADKIQDLHRLQNEIKKALKGAGVYLGEREFSYPYGSVPSYISRNAMYYITLGGHAFACFGHGFNKVDCYDPNVGLVHNAKRSFMSEYCRAIVDSTIALKGESSAGTSKYNIKFYKFQPALERWWG